MASKDLSKVYKEAQQKAIHHYLQDNPSLSAFSSYYDPVIEKIEKQDDSEFLMLIPFAKQVLMFNSDKLNYQENCKTLAYIIKYIFELTPAEFDSSYNTEFLKRYNLKNICNHIVELTPEKVLKNNGFDTKNTILQSVWPEYYLQKFDPEYVPGKYTEDQIQDRLNVVSSINAEVIFNCSGTLKCALSRAALPKIMTVNNGEPDMELKENSDGTFEAVYKENADGSYKTIYKGDPNTCHGNTVDLLLYDAITEHLNNLNNDGLSDAKKLEFLASYKEHYKPISKAPGVFKIIAQRQIYANPLDFYMFNSSTEFQKRNLDTYMELRHKYFPQQENPLINAFYYYFKEKENDMERDFDE